MTLTERRYNRPGLAALTYRVGDFQRFRDALLARLSDGTRPALTKLTTRAEDDPTIAFLDAWATVGEVLTFYQERLANEGYLRTATQRRSILELASLVGYRPGAGVAASVTLAYVLDAKSTTRIPAGSGVQNVPGQGETPQFYETTDVLDADGAWNAIKPRRTRPVQAADVVAGPMTLYVDGTSTGIDVNDPVLLLVQGVPRLRHVARLEAEFDRKRTRLTLRSTETAKTHTTVSTAPSADFVARRVDTFTQRLGMAPASHPQSAADLIRTPALLFTPRSETAFAVRTVNLGARLDDVYTALANDVPTGDTDVRLYRFRSHGAPFGSAAPKGIALSANGRVEGTEEWTIRAPSFGAAQPIRIELSFMAQGAVSRPGFLAAIEALASGQRIAGTFHIASAIDFEGNATVEIEPKQGAQATATLAADSNVVVTLGEYAPREQRYELTYVFQKSGVVLIVRDTPNGVVVEQRGQAAGSLKLDPIAVTDSATGAVTVTGQFEPRTGTIDVEQGDILHLDRAAETITPESWVAFEAPPLGGSPVPAPMQIDRADIVTRVAYGQSGKSTRLQLRSPAAWIDPKQDGFERIRQLRVYADSVELALVDIDLTDAVPLPGQAATIELDGLYPGLTSGRWAIVQGERTDLPKVVSAELVMITAAEHGVRETEPTATDGSSAPLPGEQVHTTLTFAAPLGYTYKRETVTIYGNVVQATQGQSVAEVLGSGRGGVAGQRFTLKKPPLTFVAAATPSGNVSTLVVRVNGQRWHEVENFLESGPGDRVFVTEIGEDDSVSIRFGDGARGARLPTGTENVRANYRAGLGRSGNVAAGTISTLMSRPLGVRSVINPIDASGGANRDHEETIRRTAPLGLNALDRLVSIRDHADFALSFAGVGKATAVRFAGASGPFVQVTIAGSNGDPVPPSSALRALLAQAFRDFGDTEQAVQVDEAERLLVLARLEVRVDADFDWPEVEARLRSILLDRFAFDRRGLGQTLYRSEVLAAAQAVVGVVSVMIECLTGVRPGDAGELAAIAARSEVRDIVARPAAIVDAGNPSVRRVRAAELAFFSPEIADLLLLEQASA